MLLNLISLGVKSIASHYTWMMLWILYDHLIEGESRPYEVMIPMYSQLAYLQFKTLIFCFEYPMDMQGLSPIHKLIYQMLFLYQTTYLGSNKPI